MSALITAMCATHHLPEESMPWMEDARRLFGDLVIFIDENRVTEGTALRAKSAGARVRHFNVDAWYDADWAAMARSCESDWVFIMDYDEQPSPDWEQDSWRDILEATELTHFWCPRRWVVPGGRYITSWPLWPDLQLRVLRNGIAGTAFPDRLHDLITVPGPGGLLQHLGLYHHNLSLWSRAAREEKVRQYEELRPGGGLRRYYLYEDFSYRMAALPARTVWDAGREVVQMRPLSHDDIGRVSLGVSGVPAAVDVAETFWIDASVENATDAPLVALPPYAVRLAYHWIQQSTGMVVVFEGDRTELFPCVDAHSSVQCVMRIEAPGVPGAYILQATMVQESVCWFESVRPDIVQEFKVHVGIW
jgi:hypothetical protein